MFTSCSSLVDFPFFRWFFDLFRTLTKSWPEVADWRSGYLTKWAAVSLFSFCVSLIVTLWRWALVETQRWQHRRVSDEGVRNLHCLCKQLTFCDWRILLLKTSNKHCTFFIDICPCTDDFPCELFFVYVRTQNVTESYFLKTKQSLPENKSASQFSYGKITFLFYF